MPPLTAAWPASSTSALAAPPAMYAARPASPAQIAIALAAAPAAQPKKTLDLQQKHKEARLACIADIAKAGKDANRKFREVKKAYEMTMKKINK
jgi:hypothetical protein